MSSDCEPMESYRLYLRLAVKVNKQMRVPCFP